MSSFEQALKRLNEQQLEAVKYLDGPLLVVAGPGTGKTELLAARVANILKITDTRAKNVLCLTFTNKAALNMKERIIELTGSDGAQVVASTFHSFAAEIMNTYPDHFWNAAPLSVAPESIQLDILEDIVSKLPLSSPLALRFAGQYTLLNDIQKAINLVKDAGLTPKKLKSIIQTNLIYIDTIEGPLAEILNSRLSVKSLNQLLDKVEGLPKQKIDQYIYPLTSLSTVITESLQNAINVDEGTAKTINTGKWKKRWIQTIEGQAGMFNERRRNQWWLELAEVYKLYRREIHKRGFYDYADMLVEVNYQLEHVPEMLADVQERFNYVLIDEFQDANPAQMRLAYLVSSHFSSGEQPSLMAVGDDDQSIFKFNGADLNNMRSFRRIYPAAKIIVLTKNYRSSQTILDIAQKIIEQAEVRLTKMDKGLNKHLIAMNPPKTTGHIRAYAYSSQELQLSLVAKDIKKSYKPGTEIAVLARGHESLIKMAGILSELGVPVRYEQQSNILDHQIVEQVYRILKALQAIGSGDSRLVDSLIHQIIRHPAWGFKPQDLWQLAMDNFGKEGWLDILLKSSNKSFRAWAQWLINLAQQASLQPLAIILEQTIGLRPVGDYTSPLRNYFLKEGATAINQYLHSLSAIQLLRALVFEFARQAEPTIAEFCRFIELNKENKRIIADESPFITGSQAVQLLSVHKAKGLEFDHIYIIDAIDNNWRPKRTNRGTPANLPLQPVGDDFDDYVRLMFVATTRARSNLTITGYSKDHAGKELAISQIVESALKIHKVDQSNEKHLVKVLEQALHWPDISGGGEREILKARLETYNLSITHLLNFLDITRGGPQYFKERNLLRLPETKTTSLSFGTAMHSAMEEAQRLVNKGIFEQDKVRKVLEAALKKEQLADHDFTRLLKKGRETLDRLFSSFDFELPVGSIGERQLKNVRVGQALISGKLDRIDNYANKILITDYKTGTPLGSFNTKDKNKSLKALKHRYQLIFYALLMHGSSDIKDIEGQMVYLEAGTKSQLIRIYKPSPGDLDHMKRLVNRVWGKIINVDLPDISGYSKDFDGVLAFEHDLLK